MSEQEIIKRAVYKFGPQSQEVKTIEELSELSQAICKVIDAQKVGSMNNLIDCMSHMYEEIADVEIMLAQIREIFSDADSEIRTWRSKKLQRLAIRMGVRR